MGRPQSLSQEFVSVCFVFFIFSLQCTVHSVPVPLVLQDVVVVLLWLQELRVSV